MTKKELRKIPELLVTEEMKTIVRNDKGYRTSSWNGGDIWYPNKIWFYRVQKVEEVLEIAIFTRETILSCWEHPKYRVFLQEGRYDTLDVVTNKWRTSTIENLPYEEWSRRPDYYYYAGNGLWIADEDREVLLGYVGGEKKEPMAAVQLWQSEEKKRTELAEIDSQMRLVPDLPEDFESWILSDGIQQYLFYTAGEKEGCCTACSKQVKVSPKYNKEVTCPNCGRKLTCKTVKKARRIRDEAYVGIIQPTAEGYVYRHFYVVARYEDGRRIDGGVGETVRIMYDKKFEEKREYEYFRYKRTDKVRWCNRTYGYGYWGTKVPEHQVTLYWDNLTELLKGTNLEHSAIELFAKERIRFYPEEYMKNYKDAPGMEQLVKCGFYTIVKTIVRNGSRDYMELSETSAPKILNLRKDYYHLLAGTDPTKREHAITFEFQEMGIMPTREQIAYLAKYGCGRDFAIYARHTTVHKLIRYLHEKLKNEDELIIEYHDYLQMAAVLRYDLSNEWVLYPKNLQMRHAQLIEEKREQDIKIKEAEDKKKDEMFHKIIEENGWKHYEMEEDHLLLRLPREVSEIRQEGNIMHHCVATYIDRMVAGDTCILFLRDRENPEIPYYTMEVREGKVVQCRAKYNGAMTEEVKTFVEKFKQIKLRTRERKAS